VLQICDLENDGMNCSIVIKMASVHLIHDLLFLPISTIESTVS